MGYSKNGLAYKNYLERKKQWRKEPLFIFSPGFNGMHKRQRQYRQEKKIEVLTHYGNGKCACVQCGESRLACLSLDHINGRGAEERRKQFNKRGTQFYLHLRAQGYPAGYQTLCMNCQFVKRWMNFEFNNQYLRDRADN